MLLFNAAHHHAQVSRLNHHANALRIDSVLNGLSDLHRQTFLHLQAAGKDIDEARNLAQAQDLAVWDISDMNLAEKRKHVVLAEAEHLNVFHDHHFVIWHVKERALQDLVGTLLIALS